MKKAYLVLFIIFSVATVGLILGALAFTFNVVANPFFHFGLSYITGVFPFFFAETQTVIALTTVLVVGSVVTIALSVTFLVLLVLSRDKF